MSGYANSANEFPKRGVDPIVETERNAPLADDCGCRTPAPRAPSARKDTLFPSSTVRRCCLIAVVDVEKYAQRLVMLERELVRKLEGEVEAGR